VLVLNDTLARVATAVANAAVYGDDFKWHLDMDPAGLVGRCSLARSNPRARTKCLKEGERRLRVYREAPGFRPGPR